MATASPASGVTAMTLVTTTCTEPPMGRLPAPVSGKGIVPS